MRTIAIGGPDALTLRDAVRAYEDAGAPERPIRSVPPGDPIPGLPEPIWGLAAGLDELRLTGADGRDGAHLRRDAHDRSGLCTIANVGGSKREDLTSQARGIERVAETAPGSSAVSNG